jgi:eukaryotic-like serine/threonine-protein kinase
MKPASWEKAKIIFEQAMALTPGARARFLDEVCPDDEITRREVEELLISFDETASFLETPAVSMKNHELASGQVFGHYEILRQIGAGGMGEVYLAEDKKLDRRVAIKILNAEFSRHESNLQRFIREAKAASALNHPNILVIHEIGESEEAHFIVSEYIQGQTLREVMQTERRQDEGVPSLSEVLDIAIQIAAALVAAHEAHLVHRDIKPENIMIRPDGFVKVLDFGLAKLVEQKNRALIGLEDEAAEQNNTARGVILGTVSYMSPEQAKGERVDERTDIFSFGVLLYEMIAGRTPFGGDSVPETFANLIYTEPPPLKNLAPEQIPAALDRIITKALRKNPDERYRTSNELLIDLQRLRQQLEIESHLERSAPPEASNQTTTAISTARTTARRTGQLRLLLPVRRAIIPAIVLLTLMLGALAYERYWRQTSVTPQVEIKSLAVLPLKSLDSGDNYLGLGIADAVIRRISQTGELTVRPTSAVRRYLTEETDALTAARQLNADAVLEGSVQRADDRLRVSVSLLRTGDGASLWAESFDMRTADIFTIQDTVAQRVASRLRLRLDPAQQARLDKRSTSNAIAYEYYVRGVHSLDQRGFGDKAKPQMEATIAYFKKAIEADPNYALARAQLANAYIWMALFIEEQAVWAERAKEEIDRADALDSQLAETHVARHWLLGSAYEGWQSEAAVRELLLAQQLNPNVGQVELGSIYYHLGLEDLGDRAYQRALEIDPTSEYVKYMIYAHYFLVSKYDEAFAAFQRFNPNAPTPVWYFMGKGRLDEAQKALDELAAKKPDSPGVKFQQAFLAALKGDFRTAEAEITSFLSKRNPQAFDYHHTTYDIACIYALAGKSDEAVKWLRKTAAEGFPSYTLFERDPNLNRIRQAPEFIRFMEEMKAHYERYKREFS